jgi:hypothetical protein
MPGTPERVWSPKEQGKLCQLESVEEPRMKKCILGVAAAVLFFTVPVIAHAEIVSTDSVEWMTVDCELVVKGKVAGVVKSPGEGDQVYEDVTVSISEVLKSDYKGTTVAFRWMTYKGKKHKTASNWQKSKHEMLFFLIKGDPKKEKGSYKDRWTLRTSRTAVIDLDNPGKSAITADFKKLEESKDVLKAVRARVALIKQSDPKLKKHEVGREPSVFGPQKGFVRLDVPAFSQAWEAVYADSACYLIVPPDYQYKVLAMQLCKSKDIDDRVSGTQMLCNYPDKEVIELLKAYLNDTTMTKYGDGEKVVKIVYCVRKAAYESLLTLGEKVQKPVLEKKPKEEQKSEMLEKEALQILRKACVKNRNSAQEEGVAETEGCEHIQEDIR